MILTRNKAVFLAFLNERASALTDYRIEAGTVIFLPFCEGASTQPVLTCGMSFEMLHDTDPKKRHTVTIMLSRLNDTPEPEFHFVCGDSFLSGTNAGGASAATERIEKAIVHAGLAGRAAAKKLMQDCHGRFPADSGCGFWKGLKNTPDGPGCKHVQGLFAKLVADGEAEKVLGDLEAAYARPFGGRKRRAKESDEADSLIKELRRLAGPTRSFKVPILVEGPKGFGKTVAGRVFGDTDFEHCIEVAGSAGLEQFDFLGGNLALGGGNYVWMDGPVTEAFRLAAAGKKTLLLIDEVYRVPRRERSLFLTALSPHKGCYRLRTGRPLPRGDGTASMEFISAPVENLSVIGTTNSGDDYDVEADDPAAYERWLVLLHDPGVPFVESILKKTAKERGFSDKIVAKLLKFRANCEKLKADRNCKDVPSPRLLARAILLADSESDVSDVAEMLIPALIGRAPDGRAIKEQREAVEMAHSKAFTA